MSSPGLKPTVEWRNSGPQAELVDRATSRALVLSPLEARLLSLWDGVCSASRLTDVARAHGLVIEGRQVAVFLERVSRAGFLAALPAIDSGLVPDAPGLERLEDRVPKLRADLLIEKPAGAKGVLRVTDPLKGRSFTLYDFEVSIARLLDGRRTAGDVIGAAVRLGIPVTLESLRTFVRQLRGYRFIDERAPAPGEPPAAAPSPEAWTPEERELYESALRLRKQGRPTEAIEYLAALLEVNPNLEEPAELKARLEAERDGELHVDLDFDSLHGVVKPLVAVDAVSQAAVEPPPGASAAAAPSAPRAILAPPASSAAAPPAPQPSRPSARSPAVPAPAPSPSRPPPAGASDALPQHASPAPGAHASPMPSPAGRPVPGAAAPDAGAMVTVPFSTPSQLLRHDMDPFLLYERGMAMTADVSPASAAPPKPPARSIAIPAAARAPDGAPGVSPGLVTPPTPSDTAPAGTAPSGVPPAAVASTATPDIAPTAPASAETASTAVISSASTDTAFSEGASTSAADLAPAPLASTGVASTAPADAASAETTSTDAASAGTAAASTASADTAASGAGSPSESRPAKPFASSPSLEQFVAENGADADLAAAGLARSRAWPKRLLPAVAGGVGLVLVGAGAWLVRPVPRHFTAPARLTRVAPHRVTATRAGDVGPHAVEDGALVQAGQWLGALDDTGPKQRLADLEARRAAIERRLAALAPAAEKKVAPVAKKAELARALYASAATKLERALALPPARRKAALAKAKKEEAAAKARLTKAEAALEALTHKAERQKLADEAAALERETVLLREALAAPPFTAPVAGKLTWLKAAGEAVQPGDAVLQVDPGQWKVRADVHVTLPAGTPVEARVVVGDATLEVRELEVTDAAADGVVESSGPLAATATLELSAGEGRAWERFFGPD
jgi:hypothetical protein